MNEIPGVMTWTDFADSAPGITADAALRVAEDSRTSLPVGITVNESSNVPIGEAILGMDMNTHRTALYVHPLDVIAHDNRNDPDAHLDQAIAWLLKRVRLRFDTARWRLDRRIHELELQDAKDLGLDYYDTTYFPAGQAPEGGRPVNHG